jgi:hypothetical protein
MVESSRAFSALREEFVEVTARHDPVAATTLGIHDYEHQLPDDSPEGIHDRLSWLDDFERRLIDSTPAESLELPQRIELSFLGSRIATLRWEFARARVHAFDPARYPENLVKSVLILLSRSFAPLEERKESVVARLLAAPDYLDSGRASLERAAPEAIGIAGESSIAGASFVDRVVRTLERHFPGEGERIEHAGGRARMALIRYQEFLERDLKPRGARDLAIGPELYAARLEGEHLLSPDLESWQRRVREAMTIARAALDEQARLIDPASPWPLQLETERRRHPVAQRLREAYQSEIESARRFVEQKRLAVIPDGRLEVADAPSFARGVLPSPAYLPPAPFDLDHTGYCSVTPVDPSRPRAEQEEQLAAHPLSALPLVAARLAYPGCHLLRLHGIRSGSRLRRMAANEAFEGGWILHAGEAMEEEGYFPDPHTRLFQRREVFLAACRAWIDLALHRGTMSLDQAILFLREEAMMDAASAAEEAKRAVLHPTRGLAAYAGFDLLHEMRAEAKQRMGLRYTLSDFHAAVLAGGVLPLALVREEMPERINVA